MALENDLERVAGAVEPLNEPDEQLAGLVAAEAAPGERTYLCAFVNGSGRTWLVVDGAGQPLTGRDAVRRTVSITAMCELAEESAGGGELGELRERLVALRLTENPPGI